MNTQLVTTQTENTHQITDRLVAELRGELKFEAGVLTLVNLPTIGERSLLEERHRDLHKKLQKVDYSNANKALAGAAVAEMFAAMNFNPNPKVKEESIGFHVSQMLELPLFAVEQACQDVIHNRVDGLNPDYRPTIPRLIQIAKQIAKPVEQEYTDVRAFLSVKHVRFIATSQMTKTISEGLSSLAQQLAAKGKREDDEHRNALARETIDRNRQRILDEYAARGMAPVYGPGGEPVSFSLLRFIERDKANAAPQRDAYRNEGS